MTIKKKLNLIFSTFVLLFAIMIAINYINVQKVDDNVDEILQSSIEKVKLIDEVRYTTALQGLYARSLILNNNEQNQQSYQLYRDTLDETLLDLEDFMTSDELKGYMTSLNTYNDAYNELATEIVTLVNNGELDQAQVIINEDLRDANEGILAVAAQMSDYENKNLEDIKQRADNSVSTTMTSSVVIFIISIIIAIIIILNVSRTIIRPLTQTAQIAEVIANGDLTVENLDTKTNNEIGQLNRSFNKMKANIAQLVINLQNNAQHLNATAEELTASTEEVSASTGDVTRNIAHTAQAAQTAALMSFESARAMEETATGVNRIAEATQVLNNVTMDTNEQSVNGIATISNAKDQMTSINDATSLVNTLVQKLAEQTEEISSITKVITDITDQTNLLALNAAIEAARAGEHGKGFAVVADEVRKLAEQSKISANSITALTVEIQQDTQNVESAVKSSMQAVQNGVVVINDAGTSFEEISKSIETMYVQVQEISATAEQLSASAEEVTASVGEIANGAEGSSNALETISAAMEEQTATMEQVNHVAVEVGRSAEALLQEVQQFRV